MILLPTILMVVLTSACRTKTDEPPLKKDSLPIMVQTLECKDPVLAKMLTLCVIERLVQRHQSASTLREETQTRIVIRGTVYQKDVSAAGSNSTSAVGLTPYSGFGGANATSNAFAASIVEGVSLIAFLDGKEIGSETYFQAPRKGTYQSPQTMLQTVTDRIYVKLIQRGLIQKR